MNKLMNAVFALFLCVSFAHAQGQTDPGKTKPEKRDTPRESMLKERTPEQKKLADCSLKASSQELAGKDRDKFIEKCMGK
jgi:hypothetical protein